MPPIKRSTVLLLGRSTPRVVSSVQLEPPPPESSVPQVRRPLTVSRAVQVGYILDDSWIEPFCLMVNLSSPEEEAVKRSPRP